MTHRDDFPAVAVIGLACHYPDARTPRQLWANILTRRRQFRRLPDCRLPLADYYDADKQAPDKTYGRQAALIDGFEFDWADRRIPFSTVQTTDIVHWLALEVSMAAVADAGYTRKNLPGRRTGVIVGNTLTGEQTRSNTMRLRWPFVRRALLRAADHQGIDDAQLDKLVRAMKDRFTAAFPPVDEDTLAGGLSNTIAGRICNQLDLMGGGFTIDGACSSSLLAVAHAASRIRAGELDLAVVGGVDISLDPFELIGFAKTGALTDGDMSVYDRGGKGFIPGEGCGFVVLKSLDAARRDNDRVYAVIHGWGISSDGGGSGITAPSAAGQALALERAYRHAPHTIADVDFIEGHGTGTTVGDRTELEGIARLLGQTPVSRGQLRPCGITSLKSIIGHTKAASGIGGLIKAVMAVNRRVIPPTSACHDPHQAFDHAARQLYPVRQGLCATADRKLTAGVSAMGFGGINCHLTLASADAPDDRLAPGMDESVLMAHAQDSELFVLGAAERKKLLDRIDAVKRMADGISIAELADLSAECCRQVPDDASIRAAIVAGHPDELMSGLTRLADTLVEHEAAISRGVIPDTGPDVLVGIGGESARIGFLFPGQGSQLLNMARIPATRFGWAGDLVDLADRITGSVSGIPVSRLIYRDVDRAPGPEERERWFSALSRSEHAQPAICLASLLWFEWFSRLGIRPHAVGGHSLGELTAFCAAGVMKASTLLDFAARRGQAMSSQSGVTGAMVTLRCDGPTAAALIEQADGYLTVANLNGPHQTIVSGETDAIESMIGVARENGISVRKLPVSGAFHSDLCADAARQVQTMDLFAEARSSVRCRLYSSTTGASLDALPPLNMHFSRQICSQVDFIGMVASMGTGCDLLVELGPGRVLTGLVADIAADGGPMALPVEASAGSTTDLHRCLGTLYVRGVPIQWDGLFDNRLIHPFIPAVDRDFVVNPCENLPRMGEDPVDAAKPLPADVHAVLTEAFSGMAADQVHRYLDARGGFLNRMVQADLEFWDPTARPKSAAAGMGDAPGVDAGGILYDLIAEVTGFPRDSLSPDARLLDDLNLDSIKAGDLVARFAGMCGIAFPDPALLANAALGELIDAARRLGATDGPAAGRPTVDTDELGRQMVAMTAAVTGFPEASISLSMRLLDDLNLDSIKAGDLVNRLAGEAGVSGRLDVQPLVNASLARVVEQVANALEPAETAPPDALAVLIEQAARITGFGVDTLDPDLPVEQGLNLDPDKLGSLIRITADKIGIQANVDMEPLLTRSLRQIGAIMNRMAGQRQAAPGGIAGVPDEFVWVRSFAMDLVDTPYPPLHEKWRSRSENDWQKARVLILHGDDGADVAETLGKHLFTRGAYARAARFDGDRTHETIADPAFSHLVAILPKNGRRDDDRAALLQRLIRMRASITVAPPAASAPRRRSTVVWVQFGGGFFGRDPRFARLDRTGALALAASVHLEREDLKVRVVDFCPTLSSEVVAGETLSEMVTQESFAAVGYDMQRIRRTFLPRLVQPAGFEARSITWDRDDVILVTGGAKGITAACALAVARRHPVRMALVGRSPHPQQSENDPIRAMLDRYAELGLDAAYYSCDMADRKAVTTLLESVTRELGPVTGIIHGAGINRPRLTGQVPPRQAFDEVAPKVLGMLHLLDALAHRPPKLIVAMGSIIGITGMPGNGWYGFSNEIMDVALRGFAADHPQVQTLNVAYSIWRNEGMGARMGSVDILREKGIDAIPTDEGVGRFLHLFSNDPGSRQVVVTARLGGLDTWGPPLPDAPRQGRFLDRPVQILPSVEAVFSTHLSLETDPYLKDHHFQGSYLFPTVFGLEAMAQAVLCLTDLHTTGRIRIQDVRLERPITVDEQDGADIIVRAIQEETEPGKGILVRAGIVKQGTGVRSPFFQATFVLDGLSDADPPPAIDFPDTPLPLVPQSDLYRPSLLFQGRRFQGIRTVWEIRQSGDNQGQALLTVKPMPPDRRSEAAFDRADDVPLCLGDPFFTDTLLQSAALLVPQDTSLPVAIDRIDLYPSFFEAQAPVRVRTVLEGRSDQELIYRVDAFGEDGTALATLQGYRLRILKHHDDYPTVTDLVAPQQRDRQLVQGALDNACRDLSLTAPLVELACTPGIHDMPRPRRREVERPLLDRLLAKALSGHSTDRQEPVIGWRDDGKPYVEGVAAAELDVSLTHDDRTCLCICGPGPAGCDLSAVTVRSREQWEGLLGRRRAALLDPLIDGGDDPDLAGTRIWAAAEAMLKAGVAPGAALTLNRRVEAWVLFSADTSDGDAVLVLSLPVRLTWGVVSVLALTVTEKQVPRVPAHLLTADYPGYEPLYNTRSFEMIEGGPQGQLVFVQRLPVTFQPAANLSRTIYFSNFIKWMGNTREASAWPVLAAMSDQFATGRWGGVTNYGHLKILGEGGTSDRIEILMWVSDNSGPENSTMTLSYDFRSMLPDGGYRRLAFCRLQTTWVEILGPGKAKVAPYPPYYGQFIEDMCPRNDAPDTPEPMEETLGHLFDTGDDPLVYAAPSGPMVRPIVREQVFDTTLAHANLVGNIYYANYYDWQGQIRDRFFYELIPDHFGGIGEKGELLTLESRVDHLREAMPFDRIRLTLAVRELRRCSVSFHVDYFRIEPDGDPVKLAHGLHRAVWINRDAQGRPVATPFPGPVRAAFDAAIGDETS